MRTYLTFACALAITSAFGQTPEHYRADVISKKPQSRDLFVQGLEIHDNALYVSSGLYGRSKLLRYDFASGSVLDEIALGRHLFAEGVTVLDDTVYQLTWRKQRLLLYDRKTLQLQSSWRLRGQGWGLTNDGTNLIYSDGSDRLYFLSTEDGRYLRTLRVTEAGKVLNRLNELEWVDGRIWANVWQQNRIVMIDAASGEVTGSIDLNGLLPEHERRPETDVLNGIARNPADGSIWVTGKRWPWLYEIRLAPINTSDQRQKTSDSR